MTGWLYNLIWRLARPLIWIQMWRRLSSGKEDRNRLQERYGKAYAHSRPSGPLIWLHAVSVGESVAALSLVRALYEANPKLSFLITTNTQTAAAKINAAKGDLNITHAYQPLDHPKWVSRFLQIWQPDAAIFLESDFWPNLINLAAKRSIPVYFASAQLSKRAAQRWQKQPKLAAQIFTSADLVFAVDDTQAHQFHTLSVPKTRVSVEGSLKLDLDQLKADAGFVSGLDSWQRAAGKPLLLLASSHEGEEQLVMDALADMPDATKPLLVIAPRHPHRADMLASRLGHPNRRSQNQLPKPSDEVYLADTLGEMGSLFQAADIVLLGGSFVPVGGHNPLEPASFAKPILTGPSQFKNQGSFEALAACGALKILSDISELPTALDALHNSDLRQDVGRAGADIAAHASAASRRVGSAILQDLKRRGRV